MKFFLATLISLSTMFVSGQSTSNVNNLFRETGNIKLAEHGWFTLSMGTVIGASTYYIHHTAGKEAMTPPVIGGVVFASTVTIGLYIISFDRDKNPQKSKHPRWL